MKQLTKRTQPFLEDEEALALAAIINRFAASFDVKERLSLAQAREVLVLLIRIMDPLLRAYPKEFEQLIASVTPSDDGTPEPDESN